jgi:hypothetical protein
MSVVQLHDIVTDAVTMSASPACSTRARRFLRNSVAPLQTPQSLPTLW